MKPTIGRMVHFYERAEGDAWYGPYAALIIGLPRSEADIAAGCVDLQVFQLKSQPRHERVPFSDEPDQHVWCWPPMV